MSTSQIQMFCNSVKKSHKPLARESLYKDHETSFMSTSVGDIQHHRELWRLNKCALQCFTKTEQDALDM